MAKTKPPKQQSAFETDGLGKTVDRICEEIRKFYLWDQIPWVIGYSGGKDSSAVLQLVWLAIKEIPPAKRKKQIHVISTDTLVEQPIVSLWVDDSHAKMRKAAAEQEVPITPHKLSPATVDTFWVNLIGKGYPKPTNQFRWCTSRMKINPSNNFIRNVIRENGEALLVLGTRKAESQRRARNMSKAEEQSRGAFLDERLSVNTSLPNSRVFTPIEDWTNDDVWLFLMQVKNPWGHTNKSLLGMYQGASEDNECPLVVDTSTPSCGSSRFGCWVCTVVDKDRSMEAMIKNDQEKEWMAPLLELRNELACIEEGIGPAERKKIGKKRRDKLSDDDLRKIERSRRDYRRIDGRVMLFKDATIPGPYTKAFREHWVRRVLEIQKQIRELGPKEVAKLELISMAELQEIRRIWLDEKHEFDDSLPTIYQEVMGEEFPIPPADDKLLGAEDWEILADVCDGDERMFRLQADLLDVERQYRGMTRRAGVYDELVDRLKASQFADEDEAIRLKREEKRRLDEAQGKKDEATHTPQLELFGEDDITEEIII
ncbi:DNA phosphorothioation system sulfurtransferase DndC [Rhodopirellula halodulae]|uniref:DNA phosphorothioation system sulfurtransferase DndC n=1 Tax=Rhodopirellula halodulae TaxID=2894198 RepID=UPI001E5F6223|nr:DNA phosphorothioation system sulfurtransferase DndC [Rhodopirellula sp. JC737]MCC9654581.1 DNA phosphorothioation system sulfurtransferase DndC [Rhodopirellula sp. JC737]